MHIGTWDHAAFLGRSCDVEDALTVMREANLGGAVMAPTDRCDNAGLLAEMRSHVADSTRKMWFVAWVRPEGDGLPGASDLVWLEQNLDHVAGIKIHPSLSRERITAPCYRRALELADAHERVVLVHCGRWQEKASYKFAVEAARRYPRARFLLAHAGGDTPPLANAAAQLVKDQGVQNVWFEFSGLREYWVIERNVALLGAERYLMGSDYGLAHPLMYLGAVRAMALSDADKRLILGDNAVALFGADLRPA